MRGGLTTGQATPPTVHVLPHRATARQKAQHPSAGGLWLPSGQPVAACRCSRGAL